MINASFLAVLAYVYYPARILGARKKHYLSLIYIPVAIFIGVIILNIPIKNDSGLYFDLSSIVVMTAGFVGGWICGLPVAIAISVLRFILEREGALDTVFVLITSGIVGSYAHRFFISSIKKLTLRLLLLGVISFSLILLSALLVPQENRIHFIRFTFLPVLIVNPLCSLLIGFLIGFSEYRLQLKDRLEESETNFKGLFDNNPVPLWLEDLSEVYKAIKFYSINDIESLEFTELKLLFTKIRISSLNKSAVSFIRGRNERDVIENIEKTLNRQSYAKFRNELLHMKQGGNFLQTEGGFRDFEGNDHSVIMSWNALNGPSHNYNKVLVSFLDVTDREEHQQQMAVLNREVHHRINNNLNMVAQLIQLEEDMNNGLSLEEVLKGLQQKIKAISLVHSQLYTSRDQNFVELHEFFKQLFGSLSEIMELDIRNISLNLNFDKVLVFTETAVTCGLLINELLAQTVNCLKDSGGEITCTLAPCSSGVLLTYKDTRKKDSLEEDNMLSSLLVETFIDKLEGEGQFPENDDETFSIEIRFPVYVE